MQFGDRHRRRAVHRRLRRRRLVRASDRVTRRVGDRSCPTSGSFRPERRKREGWRRPFLVRHPHQYHAGLFGGCRAHPRACTASIRRIGGDIYRQSGPLYPPRKGPSSVRPLRSPEARQELLPDESPAAHRASLPLSNEVRKSRRCASTRLSATPRTVATLGSCSLAHSKVVRVRSSRWVVCFTHVRVDQP